MLSDTAKWGPWLSQAISSTAKLTSDLAHISVGSQWDVRPSPSTDSDVADLSPDQLTQKLFRVSMEHERRMEGMIHQSTPVFPWLDIAVLTRQWHVRDLFDYCKRRLSPTILRAQEKPADKVWGRPREPEAILFPKLVATTAKSRPIRGRVHHHG